jgi:hypothetical protein
MFDLVVENCHACGWIDLPTKDQGETIKKWYNFGKTGVSLLMLIGLMKRW